MTIRVVVYRQARSLPFGQPLLHSPYVEATRSKQRHHFERQNAVGTSAISHDLVGWVEFRQPALEFRQRDVDRAGDMAGGEFVGRAHVEHGYETPAGPLEQLLARNRLHAVAVLEIAAQDP